LKRGKSPKWKKKEDTINKKGHSLKKTPFGSNVFEAGKKKY
jgi:hypothetical protein